MMLHDGLQGAMVSMDHSRIVASIRVEETRIAYRAPVCIETGVHVSSNYELVPTGEGGQGFIQKAEPLFPSPLSDMGGMVCKLVGTQDI